MLHHSPLGSEVQYPSTYSPNLLFPIPRRLGRDAIGVPQALPFDGVDMWTGFELSWLNTRGKPQIAVVEFTVPASTPHLIESKSLKLYLNSLNGHRFGNVHDVEACLRRDVSRAAGAAVAVRVINCAEFGARTQELEGVCIDDLDIEIKQYDVDPALLRVHDDVVDETLRSDLLKSNCPVTGQPDWASVMIKYRGPRIDREALLAYIVSFREHSGFHEQCVEQMFQDIKTRCKPTQLTVYARYTRRGGLDINPFRSDFDLCPPNRRTFRQ